MKKTDKIIEIGDFQGFLAHKTCAVFRCGREIARVFVFCDGDNLPLCKIHAGIRQHNTKNLQNDNLQTVNTRSEHEPML